MKEKFTKGLVLVVPDLDKKNEDKSWCIGLCYRRSIIYGVQRWKVETSSISLKISKWDWEKLWDSWQENTSGDKGIRKLEVFVGRHKIQVQGLNRSQELGIFHENTEIKVCSRYKNGKDRLT